MFLAALPQISLGTAAVLIFAGCLAYLMLRGIGKLLVGTAMLAASVFLGYLTWLKAPEISMAVFNKSVGLVTTGLPIVVFVACFILIRIILKWIANPFGREEPRERRPRSGKLTLARLGFLCSVALIPTVLLMVIAIGVIHHTASIAELRQQADPENDKGPTYLQQLKASIDRVVPQSLLDAIDPFAEQSRLALAKWVTRHQRESGLETGSAGALPPAIDPETGKVIPRAIIVEDVELQRLAREQKFGTLLRHPTITRALENPEVRKLVEDLQF